MQQLVNLLTFQLHCNNAKLMNAQSKNGFQTEAVLRERNVHFTITWIKTHSVIST